MPETVKGESGGRGGEAGGVNGRFSMLVNRFNDTTLFTQMAANFKL